MAARTRVVVGASAAAGPLGRHDDPGAGRKGRRGLVQPAGAAGGAREAHAAALLSRPGLVELRRVGAHVGADKRDAREELGGVGAAWWDGDALGGEWGLGGEWRVMRGGEHTVGLERAEEEVVVEVDIDVE